MQKLKIAFGAIFEKGSGYHEPGASVGEGKLCPGTGFSQTIQSELLRGRGVLPRISLPWVAKSGPLRGTLKRQAPTQWYLNS